MITLANYKEKSKGIDFSKLPEALQEGNQFVIEFADLYGEEDSITETIDLYLKKLNSSTDCPKCQNAYKDEPKAAIKKPSNLSELKKYLKKGMKLYFFHRFSDGRGVPVSNQERTVNRVQSNSVSMITETGKESWLDYPKAKEIEFFDKGFKIDAGFAKLAYYYEKQPETKKEKPLKKAPAPKAESKTPKVAVKAAKKSRPVSAPKRELSTQDKKVLAERTKLLIEKLEKSREKELKQLIAYAKEVQENRSAMSLKRDNPNTNKSVLALTHDNLIAWAKNPGKYDLAGIDTAKTRPTKSINRRISKAKIMNLYKMV